MSIEIKEALFIATTFGLIIKYLPKLQKVFSNRLKEEEVEEETKADGSYRKKTKKKYK